MTLKILLFLSLIFSSILCFADEAKKIVFIGDSLTEGYQLAKEYSFPSLIQNKINEDNLNYKVINGGVSGATSASGVSRLNWFLKMKPSMVVLALGANDGLRGLSLEQTELNLEKVIISAKEAKVKIVLAGMKIPPNYGKEYTQKFQTIYPRLATKHKVALIPFILAGVAGQKKFNLGDGIHPNKEGYRIIADNLYKELKGLL